MGPLFASFPGNEALFKPFFSRGPIWGVLGWGGGQKVYVERVYVLCLSPTFRDFFETPGRKAREDFSALGKWGRTQMGSDGLNRILTGFYLLGPVRVRLVPSGPPKHMISRGFYRILTGL